MSLLAFLTALEGKGTNPDDPSRHEQISLFAKHHSRDTTDALVEVFIAIGLLARDRDRFRLSHARHGRHFVQCLRSFVESGHTVLGTLNERGNVLWANVLGLLEERRRQLGQRAERRTSAAQALIVGVNAGRRYTLVDYDQRSWNRFKFPGGKQQAGERPLQTLRRELAEEIQSDIDKYFLWNENRVDLVEAINISKTVGALTEYTVLLFGIETVSPGRLSYSGSHRGAMRWLCLEDLDRGIVDTPEAFFTGTFASGIVRAHLRDVPAIYEIPDDELLARQVKCRMGTVWG